MRLQELLSELLDPLQLSVGTMSALQALSDAWSEPPCNRFVTLRNSRRLKGFWRQPITSSGLTVDSPVRRQRARPTIGVADRGRG